jgi:hypothetical protein
VRNLLKQKNKTVVQWWVEVRHADGGFVSSLFFLPSLLAVNAALLMRVLGGADVTQ